MSFTEKLNWAAFLALIAAFGWYFLSYPWQMIDSRAGVGAAADMLVPVVIIIIGTLATTTAYLTFRTPKEVHFNDDERERIIHMRGTHSAYYPLVLGVWGNLFAIFYQLSAAAHLNLLIATVVTAELIRVGSQLYFYRRGY